MLLVASLSSGDVVVQNLGLWEERDRFYLKPGGKLRRDQVGVLINENSTLPFMRLPVDPANPDMAEVVQRGKYEVGTALMDRLEAIHRRAKEEAERWERALAKATAEHGKTNQEA
jgi:hypothetical protein